MIPLILFIVLAVVVLVLIEWNERRKQAKSPATRESADASERTARPEGCCGEHLVCERETLLQTDAVPEYYNDEELDVLADTPPSQYTQEQHDAIGQVFSTLQEKDVPGWCRSMQLRHIALPDDIREEALLIVRELRQR